MGQNKRKVRSQQLKVEQARRSIQNHVIDVREQIEFDKLKGIPVFVNDEACTKHIHKIKRWKRLNRPDKIRLRNYTKIFYYIIKPPIISEPAIICHSKLIKKLKESEDNNENY